MELTNRFKNIGRNLKKSLANIEINYILRAKIPIIKFYFPNNIQGDISINNILAIHNTRMMKLYGELFPKMKCVGNLLKTMAKICDIGDASQGTLSSYAYMLLLIYFLQRRGYLPVLQELYEGEKKPTNIVDGWNTWYQTDADIITKLWKPKSNAVSVEYLWLDFFYYYLVEFDIDREVVSIKQSTPLYKVEKEWQMSYMSIEDPFRLDHNLSGSLTLENSVFILQCFAHVLKLHSNNDNSGHTESLDLLMEPECLRPASTTDSYNRRENNFRDLAVLSNENDLAINKELPILPTSLKYQKSDIDKHYFLEINTPDNASTKSIPLTNLNFGLHDISVLPLKLPFGDKSIVMPMLIGKDEEMSMKFDNIFQDGSHKVSPSYDCKPSAVISNTMSNNFTSKAFTTNESITNPLANNSVMLQNNEILNQNFRNQYNRYTPQINNNFVPNSVKMMTNSQIRNNTGGLRNSNYKVSNEFQVSETKPFSEPNRNRQKYYPNGQPIPTKPNEVFVRANNNYSDYVRGGAQNKR